MGIEETTREQLLVLQRARAASAISEVEFRGALRAMVGERWSIGARPGPAALPSWVETLARAVVTELRSPESDETVRRSPDGATAADALAALYPDDEATGFAEGDLRGWFWTVTEAGATP